MFTTKSPKHLTDYIQLIQAIKENHPVKVRQHLDKDSEGALSQIVNEDGQNLAHLAAAHTDFEVFEMIHQYLEKHKQLDQFQVKDKKGFYPFHYACKSNPSQKVIFFIIQQLNLNAHTQVTSVTNEYKLPSEYIKRNPELSVEQRIECKGAIHEIEAHHDMSQLFQPVLLDSILKRYTHVEEDAYRQFYLVCLIMNLIRMIIKSSSTHLETNQLSDDDYALRNGKVLLSRSNQIYVTNTNKDSSLNYNFKILNETKTGNCGESTMLGVLFSRLLAPELGSIAYHLTSPADHVYGTLGKLVFDAWSGNTYFKEEKTTYLKNYWRRDNKNYIGPVNFSCYKEEELYSFKPLDPESKEYQSFAITNAIDFLALAFSYKNFDIIKDLLTLSRVYLSAFKLLIKNFNSLANVELTEFVRKYLAYLFIKAAEAGGKADLAFLDFIVTKKEFINTELITNAFLVTTSNTVLVFLWKQLSKLPLDRQYEILTKKYPYQKNTFDTYVQLSNLKKQMAFDEKKSGSLFSKNSSNLKIKTILQDLPDSPFQIDENYGFRFRTCEILAVQLLVSKECRNAPPATPQQSTPDSTCSIL